MDEVHSLGAWLRHRRRALDLTQAELARQVGCALGTLKKLEQDARRPSKSLAAHLARVLQLSAAEQAAFLQAARGELAIDQLASAAAPRSVRPTPPTNLPIPANRLI